MKRVVVVLMVLVFLVLIGCAPREQSAYLQDPSQQTVADDQTYATMAYQNWLQQQQTAYDFNYFLLNVWANDSMRTGYYTNYFHVNTYTPTQRVYTYVYTPRLSSRSISAASNYTPSQTYSSTPTTRSLTTSSTSAIRTANAVPTVTTPKTKTLTTSSMTSSTLSNRTMTKPKLLTGSSKSFSFKRK